jgi:hypothetical protein
MRDEWSKKLPDGRTAVYKSEFLAGCGGVIEAHLGKLTCTRTISAPMTREEVEASFADLPKEQAEAERLLHS